MDGLINLNQHSHILTPPPPPEVGKDFLILTELRPGRAGRVVDSPEGAPETGVIKCFHRRNKQEGLVFSTGAWGGGGGGA